MQARQYIVAALITLVGMLGGCNASPTVNTRVLTATLASLNLANPVADLNTNVLRRDLRFIGVNGYTCVAPGVEGMDAKLVQKYGLRCLAGTSDAIENPEHSALIKKAQGYAATYNAELLGRIHSGSGT